jgi:hypothetical protein
VALRDRRRGAGGRQAVAGGLSRARRNRFAAKRSKGGLAQVRRSSASARCNAKMIRGGGDPLAAHGFDAAGEIGPASEEPRR